MSLESIWLTSGGHFDHFSPADLEDFRGRQGSNPPALALRKLARLLSFNPQIKLIFLRFHGFRPHECCLETCASSLDERLLS